MSRDLLGGAVPGGDVGGFVVAGGGFVVFRGAAVLPVGLKLSRTLPVRYPNRYWNGSIRIKTAEVCGLVAS